MRCVKIFLLSERSWCVWHSQTPHLKGQIWAIFRLCRGSTDTKKKQKNILSQNGVEAELKSPYGLEHLVLLLFIAQHILKWAQFTSKAFVHCRESDFTPLPFCSVMTLLQVRAGSADMEVGLIGHTHTQVKAQLRIQTPQFLRLILHTQTHTHWSSDLDFKLYHEGLVGRYPSILYSVTAALQPPHWTERVKDGKRRREQEMVPTSDYHGNPARPISSLQGLSKPSCCCCILGERADLLIKWHLWRPTPCILTRSASDNSEAKHTNARTATKHTYSIYTYNTGVLETYLILLYYSLGFCSTALENPKLPPRLLTRLWHTDEF